MANKMLIDAAHPEETRVVVVRGNRVEEFDFEAANRKQLRGNIYLAKVTRVEPSLQAAFVEYGGNRHGFLAFSEIHPDYYQIPAADRLALIEDERHEEERREAAENATSCRTRELLPPKLRRTETTATTTTIRTTPTSRPLTATMMLTMLNRSAPKMPWKRCRSAAPSQRKQYKIQEVIKRRQVMLVQVVKEERGNKGAALTTYLSLAGRYSVLMPNTARGGGISRKITNAADRKRLKEDRLRPGGAGGHGRHPAHSRRQFRTKAEVKRDFEYLMRLWESVRSLTLKSRRRASSMRKAA
jgi:ribonuclease E